MVDKLTNDETTQTAEKLSRGLLQIYEPHLSKVKMDLRELLAKQNKIYIDFQSEKFNFVDSNINDFENMMMKYKLYKDKLISIKKEMVNIHHRSTALKKRAQHIQSCKEKELAAKLQKQQQEEALIGKQKNPSHD